MWRRGRRLGVNERPGLRKLVVHAGSSFESFWACERVMGLLDWEAILVWSFPPMVEVEVEVASVYLFLKMG